MNPRSESPTDIETIYKLIPLGARDHARIVHIHNGGEVSISIETLSKIIGDKTCHLIDTYRTTKQHGRNIGWTLDVEREILHVNLPYLPIQ